MFGKLGLILAAAIAGAMSSEAAQASMRAARSATNGQRGVSQLGRVHNAYGEQYRSPDRAATRRRVKAWGGRRQYLKQIKALRRMRAGLGQGVAS